MMRKCNLEMSLICAAIVLNTFSAQYVYWETFEEENFHEFRGSAAICESFLHENGCGPLWFIAHNIRSVVNPRKLSQRNLIFHGLVKVISLESCTTNHSFPFWESSSVATIWCH